MDCHICNRPYKVKGGDYLCEHCVTLYCPATQKVEYGRNYFTRYLVYEASKENLPLQKIRWDTIKKYKEKGSILDLGCGVGAFLDQRPETFIPYGQEINPHCIKHCTEKGIVMNPVGQTYDIITMYDVLEHFDDVVEALTLAKDMLNPEGIIVISVPNFKYQYIYNLNEWRHYRPNEHIFCLSVQSMFRLSIKCGMWISETNYDESKVRYPNENIATYVMRLA